MGLTDWRSMRLVAVPADSGPVKLRMQGLPCLDDCVGPPNPNSGQGAWPAQEYRATVGLDGQQIVQGLRQDNDNRPYLDGLTDPAAATDVALVSPVSGAMRAHGLTKCYYCVPCFGNDSASGIGPRLDLYDPWLTPQFDLNVSIVEAESGTCSHFNLGGTIPWQGTGFDPPAEWVGIEIDCDDPGEGWTLTDYWLGSIRTYDPECASVEFPNLFTWLIKVCVYCKRVPDVNGNCDHYEHNVSIGAKRYILATCNPPDGTCCDAGIYDPETACGEFGGLFELDTHAMCQPSGEFLLECRTNETCSISITLGGS